MAGRERVGRYICACVCGGGAWRVYIYVAHTPVCTRQAVDLITTAWAGLPDYRCVRVRVHASVWRMDGGGVGGQADWNLYVLCVQEIHIAGDSQHMCLPKWYVSWQAGSAKKPAAIEVDTWCGQQQAGRE